MTVDEALEQAILLHLAGRLVEAEVLYRAIVQAVPDHGDANYHLGLIALDRGHGEDAVGLMRQAVAGNDGMARFHFGLGNALMETGRRQEAEASYREALVLEPEYADAWYNLAVLLRDRGNLAEAVVGFERAVALTPGFCAAYNNLGIVLTRLGRTDEAIEVLRRARAAFPGAVELILNLGAALLETGDLDGAISHFQQALELNPDSADGHNNLGLVLKDVGRAEEAMVHLLRAQELMPDSVSAFRNLLLAITYQPDWTPEQRFAENRRFEALYAAPLYPSAVRFDNDRDPGRRLRIGYLSSDLRTHPVAFNLLPMIEVHDPDQVELCFYAEVVAPDALSERFMARAALWRSTVGLDDAAVAEQIRADRVDVLVILAGRFDKNRPLVAALRPAPVQISYWDAATSGMTAMDAFITDRVQTPRRGTELFTERPIRLPSLYIRYPMDNAPPVAPPPMLDNDYPTLGSFNNPAKLSDATLALWARLMEALPTARLRLKYKGWFGSEAVAGRVTAAMAAHGIDLGRIDMRGGMDDAQSHLAGYGGLDLALDPFPFNGATTTFEALWMGVPVMTLLGDTFMSRWSASMLTTLKLDGELVAATPDDYVDKCVRLLADPARLADLRAGLRQRIAASPMCDGRLKARQMERVYRALWRRWLRQSCPDDTLVITG
ncbi:hypothetical protein A6A04_12055 [Paramagnetospirillum marisnigri]|uniref:protein O-GlcNAc transferase n=1 Tax=Paramagnetospirillum marisnigri TaxID=1285242 RepID=A0A178MVZ6_9PROT|nr:glycosyltransferase family 41 protein [Paramagnetospirillum marisnigri]OAN54651.1 hypothetical protein A6A04_12055 [Paramagnetospirillum marisnigri]